MTAQLINGKETALALREALAAELAQKGHRPHLAVVLAGDDEASLIYDRNKQKAAWAAGMDCDLHHLPGEATEAELLALVDRLNENDGIHGVMVQLPLPKGIDENAIIDLIDPKKDADGMHPYNLGELVLHARGDITTPLPCTPRGVIELLNAYDIDLDGKEVCVLGRGITIGRTVGLLLTRKAVNATVTLCHTGTKDVRKHMREADVIIAAMGSAGFVKPEDVKEGAVLVDVGVSRVFDEEAGRYRVKGDVDKACYEKVSAYTPNPGGVGPMTRAMLLENVVEMAERQL